MQTNHTIKLMVSLRETASIFSDNLPLSIGMAITKYIIDMMGGYIEIESEPGKGSEFHVTLDLERATVREEDMVLPPWRMLVVDSPEALHDNHCPFGDVP